nr:transposase [Liquorilactobacillus cacaonum]
MFSVEAASYFKFRSTGHQTSYTAIDDDTHRLVSVLPNCLRLNRSIQNHFESNYSNGPLEGVNRKIKQIKRTAYGYRNWSHFYTRIRIEFTIRIKKRKPIRK